jgi:hypothetical protein
VRKRKKAAAAADPDPILDWDAIERDELLAAEAEFCAEVFNHATVDPADLIEGEEALCANPTMMSDYRLLTKGITGFKMVLRIWEEEQRAREKFENAMGRNIHSNLAPTYLPVAPGDPWSQLIQRVNIAGGDTSRIHEHPIAYFGGDQLARLKALTNTAHSTYGVGLKLTPGIKI